MLCCHHTSLTWICYTQTQCGDNPRFQLPFLWRSWVQGTCSMCGPRCPPLYWCRWVVWSPWHGENICNEKREWKQFRFHIIPSKPYVLQGNWASTCSVRMVKVNEFLLCCTLTWAWRSGPCTTRRAFQHEWSQSRRSATELFHPASRDLSPGKQTHDGFLCRNTALEEKKFSAKAK